MFVHMHVQTTTINDDYAHAPMNDEERETDKLLLLQQRVSTTKHFNADGLTLTAEGHNELSERAKEHVLIKC